MARLRFCRCGAVLKRGERCEACYVPPRQKRERTTTERGYGWDWQQLSRRYRDQHPLCERCEQQGRVTPAVHVHHIEAINAAPQKRMRIDNLMGVCVACHNELDRKNGSERARWQA